MLFLLQNLIWEGIFSYPNRNPNLYPMFYGKILPKIVNAAYKVL